MQLNKKKQKKKIKITAERPNCARYGAGGD
jgi:hypothetical protein